MIFVDTSYLIAGLNPHDAHHEEAAALAAGLADRRMLTTNHVAGESWTFAQRRLGHRLAAALIDGLWSNGSIGLTHVEADIELRAVEWLRRHDEREYSFVDATSFETMRSLGIREALSFDSDFAAAGFVTLRA